MLTMNLTVLRYASESMPIEGAEQVSVVDELVVVVVETYRRSAHRI